MPLDPSLLKTELVTEMQRLHTLEYPASAAAMLGTHEIFAEAIATKVVEHLIAHGTVIPTALIAPGGMSPAPVTGTASIT